MTVVLTLAGTVFVLVALRDVFDTLFHPHAQGILSQNLIRGVWTALRRLAHGEHRVLSLAGPIAFIVVIAVWGAFVMVGFALILWPHFPESFSYSSASAATQHGFVDALYLSMVNLTSLGYGDIVPTADLLKLLGPIETLIGLGLLTASISWILFLYRVLSDYRSLSHEIALLLDAERESGIDLASVDPAVAARVLSDLTSRVIAMRDDFVHSPIAYYFHPRDSRHALPVLLPALLATVERCSRPDRGAELRFEATLLRRALEDLLATIATHFLRSPETNPEAALQAYRADHLWG